MRICRDITLIFFIYLLRKDVSRILIQVDGGTVVSVRVRRSVVRVPIEETTVRSIVPVTARPGKPFMFIYYSIRYCFYIIYNKFLAGFAGRGGRPPRAPPILRGRRRRNQRERPSTKERGPSPNRRDHRTKQRPRHRQ